ncbi:RNA-binding protein 26 [Caerostris extrusa]|uniref:RNA-binding protein 26 n=1 Tax=Caerostris extrusa TaxID=172846 RepID=A0AAV4Q9J2_CAEEX|nr:RNA-binding protein 26 [Caerostris extrusa]
MIIENAEAFKSWLTSRLIRMCDADPNALAKYILALVRKEKPEEELREFCLDQLDVFLLKDTKPFYYNSSQNDPVRGVKSENENRSDHVNSENGSRNSKPPLISSVKVKSGSPEPTHKSYQHRSRSRGDISENRRKSIDDKSDKNLKHNFLPSKKFRPRRHHYSRSSDEKFRDEKSDKRRGRGKEQLSDEDGKCTPRSDSWDRLRSRSRSPRSSSRSSRSRSRSRDRSIDDHNKTDFHTKSDSLKIQLTDHGDTDYRQKPHSGVTTSQLNNYSSKRISKRCQDYDERGYCLRGDLCVYDHGTDPILVEDVSSVLNFGVVSQDRFEDSSTISKSPKQPPPPPASPPPLPPPPPPLPPIPPPGYVPEPYNPEAPGMNVIPRVNYWVPPPVHHMAPPNHPLLFPLQLLDFLECFGNLTLEKEKEKERNKDVIKAADENSENCLKSYSVDGKNKTVILNELKRKTFDYNRLGGGPRKMSKRFNNNRTILEVRKIPQHQNNIAMLNSHFSKFGRIVNLQVGYDGDPEAALVQFMTDTEATAAYRCAEAILNNRFIKVFYHNPQKKDENRISNDISVNISNKTLQSQANNCNDTDETQVDLKQNNMSTIYTSKGNISRTVFNPSAKKNIPNFNAGTPTTLAPARRIKDDQRKKQDAMQKRLELHKKKQEFLDLQIEHQKVILDKLEKCKSEKEKEFLKQTIQTLSEQIASIQNEVKKESEVLKNIFKTANTQSLLTKTESIWNISGVSWSSSTFLSCG